MRTRSVLPDAQGWLGIDPGRSSGSITFLHKEGDEWTGRSWALGAMTDRDIWDVFAHCAPQVKLAVLENVHSMPGQGVSSSFKFGMSYGELRMGLVAAGIRFEMVSPQKWQGVLKCRSRGNKNVTKAKAQELFPRWPFRITHAIADSLLLAEYARTINT
jgi:hypothetical protein